MFESPLEDVPQRALTGDLPEESQVARLLHEAHARYVGLDEGTVADYIPALAEADPALFGLALAEADGTTHLAGDTAAPFTIQSISKAFVLALVLDAIGHEEVHRVVGVNNTGLPFNSVIALELNQGSPMNPMVNAGAIATTALLPGGWLSVLEGLSRFAGRSLELDERVLRSESETNHRNQGIADLLTSYGRLTGRPEEMVEMYTRQCSLLVSAEDLAVMGATLADGGLNPVTGEQVVSAEACRDTLAVLAACGMYELSGEWQFEIGLPAKSGVSGGIVAIAPGKGALGAFAPPLDRAGNSVRSQRACAHLSRSLGLNLFASAPRGKAHRDG